MTVLLLLFNRRYIWVWAIGFALLSCQPPKQSEQKLNVLFIAIDDLRTELNCYGSTHIHSPNIDRLAESGVRFTQAHVQQAICMASRASIMTGIRPEHQGIYTGESVGDLVPDALTLNQFFKQQGYTIAAAGKIYHFLTDRQTQFGQDYLTPKQTWTGRGYVTSDSKDKAARNTTFHRGPAYEAAQVHDSLYRDGINTLNAVRKLEELSQTEAPFFLAVGLIKPHLPFAAPQKYWDLYPESSINLPAVRQMPTNSHAYTMRVTGELNKYYGMPTYYRDIDDSTALTLRRAYYACVSYADAQVGYLLDELERLGLRENTLIVLWGDHGYKLGDYGNWCKWSNMNLDTHIPLVISVPEGKKGAICHTPVEALDIYPTLAELCALPLPEHLEGKSLKPLLDDPEQTHAQYAHSVWPVNRSEFEKTVMGYSVKDGRFNYVEWIKLNTGEVLAKELYDHRIDPMETQNVVEDTSYQHLIQPLVERVNAHKTATDLVHALNPEK